MNDLKQKVIGGYLGILLLIPGFVLALSPDDLLINESALPNYSGQEVRTLYHAEGRDAVLYMGGDTSRAAVGATTTVTIYVDPGQNAINTASMYIAYPSSALAFRGIDTSNSDFSFSFTEYSNETMGVIAYHALQPFPGISETAQVVTLIFEPREQGTSTIYFLPESEVFANDGYATEVLSATGIHRISANEE